MITSILNAIAFIPLALCFGLFAVMLFYVLPLAFWRVASRPIRLSTGKSLSSCGFGSALLFLVYGSLSSVPFGAMPCGGRLYCIDGSSFTTFGQTPTLYLLKAGIFSILALVGVLLLLIGGRGLFSKGAA